MPDIRHILTAEHERIRSEQAKNGKPRLQTEFTTLAEDHYRLSLLGATLDIDRVRREHHELHGELAVRCDLPGARTVDGILSIGNLNLSSTRARSECAKQLAERAHTPDLDWLSIVQELCQRVLAADRIGQPGIDLRDVARPAAEEALEVEGLRLLRRHPVILFGDGGTSKSYLALYFAGRLAEDGLRVGLCDWELGPEDHRERLERLFPDGMPLVLYLRAERPLVYETDRLRRIVREQNLDYLIYDSIGCACDGPPEAADVAGRYFRCVRQIGLGSLHVAHVSKSDNSDEKTARYSGITWPGRPGLSSWPRRPPAQTPSESASSIGKPTSAA
jgi:hypothetical protein